MLRQTEQETSHRHELRFFFCSHDVPRFHSKTKLDCLQNCGSKQTDDTVIAESCQQELRFIKPGGVFIGMEGVRGPKVTQITKPCRYTQMVYSPVSKRKNTTWVVTLVQVSFPGVDCAAEMVWKQDKRHSSPSLPFFFKPMDKVLKDLHLISSDGQI